MEEKKFDINSLIGFVLLGAIMIWWMYTNQPSEAEKAQQQKAQDSIAAIKKQVPLKTDSATKNLTVIPDSIGLAKAKTLLGAFGYSASLPSARDNESIFENDVLRIKVANKG